MKIRVGTFVLRHFFVLNRVPAEFNHDFASSLLSLIVILREIRISFDNIAKNLIKIENQQHRWHIDVISKMDDYYSTNRRKD